MPENHRVQEKIGTLELEDRDQIQNKEPIFSLPEDISRLFSVERSPTKDANLMLSKVRRKNLKCTSACFSSAFVPFKKHTCHQLFDFVLLPSLFCFFFVNLFVFGHQLFNKTITRY